MDGGEEPRVSSVLSPGRLSVLGAKLGRQLDPHIQGSVGRKALHTDAGHQGLKRDWVTSAGDSGPIKTHSFPWAKPLVVH